MLKFALDLTLYVLLLVAVLGRYQSDLGVDHQKVAKKVMRYLQGTKYYMFMYKRTDDLEVIGYSDSDYVGCIATRKSTFGYVSKLVDVIVSCVNHAFFHW